MATLNTHATERRHLSDRRSGIGAATRSLGIVDGVALLLMIVGGLNWGLVGLFSFDLVANLFGFMTPLSRAVYVLVGLSALYGIYMASRLYGKSPT